MVLSKTFLARKRLHSTYNKIMCGVDICDQKVSSYDPDRRSQKWWKRVFQKILVMSVVNAPTLRQDVLETKTPMRKFSIALAKELISCGRKTTLLRVATAGKPGPLILLRWGDVFFRSRGPRSPTERVGERSRGPELRLGRRLGVTCQPYWWMLRERRRDGIRWKFHLVGSTTGI